MANAGTHANRSVEPEDDGNVIAGLLWALPTGLGLWILAFLALGVF